MSDLLSYKERCRRIEADIRKTKPDSEDRAILERMLDDLAEEKRDAPWSR